MIQRFYWFSWAFRLSGQVPYNVSIYYENNKVFKIR